MSLAGLFGKVHEEGDVILAGLPEHEIPDRGQHPFVKLVRTDFLCQKGLQASSFTFLIVGAMTKMVRKSASPINTCVGGICWVARAIRVKENTIEIRMKLVTIMMKAGASEERSEEAEPAWPRPLARRWACSTPKVIFGKRN